MMIIRTYSELKRIKTLEERYEYLRLGGAVGASTFGFDRIFNQMFYASKEWKEIRRKIIFRDNGCDLGLSEYEIYGSIIIHHMNPISMDDIRNNTEYLLNPDFLICSSSNTHKAIHYGNRDLLPQPIVERRPYDTCPWKQ